MSDLTKEQLELVIRLDRKRGGIRIPWSQLGTLHQDLEARQIIQVRSMNGEVVITRTNVGSA